MNLLFTVLQALLISVLFFLSHRLETNWEKYLQNTWEIEHFDRAEIA